MVRICIWPIASSQHRQFRPRHFLGAWRGCHLAVAPRAGGIHAVRSGRVAVCSTAPKSNLHRLVCRCRLVHHRRDAAYKNGMFGRVKVKNPVTGAKAAAGAPGRSPALRCPRSHRHRLQQCGRLPDTLGHLRAVTGSNACTLCGEQETWIVGVNWCLNDYSSSCSIWRIAKSRAATFAARRQTSPASTAIDGAKIRGFGMRAQVDW